MYFNYQKLLNIDHGFVITYNLGSHNRLFNS